MAPDLNFEFFSSWILHFLPLFYPNICGSRSVFQMRIQKVPKYQCCGAGAETARRSQGAGLQEDPEAGCTWAGREHRHPLACAEYLALRRQDCCRRGSGWWDPCGCPRSGSSCDSSHQGPAGRPQRFRWLKHNMKNSRLGSLIRYRKKKEERTCQTFPPCKTCTSQAGLVSAGPPMTYRHYRYPIHKCNMCPDTYNPFQYETHINMSGAV